ncbi:MAG: 3-phosphoshikimate 1-carboxyvinyltransferase, partial [Tannerella sp.]|nr:3-phosphoshikimate 1-carboxyvinyltransferase [Tannerella sp.]
MIFRLKTPEILDSKVPIPSSKSVSNRVLILNALCDRKKKIDNISPSDDTEVMIKALESNKSDVNIKAAGTAMRFLTAYFAVKKGKWNITGTERMKNRPVKILIDALRSLGAQIECTEREGFPPLHIEGRQLKGGDVYLDGSVSSQYISALLMVAPVMTNGLRLHLTGDAVSKPYINLTVQLMRKFGVIVFVEDRTFTVPPQQYVPASNFTVESDWSAASYWYEMMALSKNNASAVSLAGLTPDSLQGDAALVGLFDRLGVKTLFTPSGVELTKKEIAVDGLFAFDFIDMPDMAQTLAVTSAMLGIPFR